MTHPFYQYATKKNGLDYQKPNEDFLILDPSLSFFLVADGISRPREEYPVSEENSIICRLNREFGDACLRSLKENPHKNPEERLKSAFLHGNEAVFQLRKDKSPEEWGFYPGMVGIGILLLENRMYFAYVGDCIGILLKENAAFFFGEEQSVKFAEKAIPDRIARYKVYCNKKETLFSFGTINGDPELKDMIHTGFTTISPGDQILLSTDGAGHYLKFQDPKLLRKMTPEEIIRDSSLCDIPPFARYADDKTVLKIEIR